MFRCLCRKGTHSFGCHVNIWSSFSDLQILDIVIPKENLVQHKLLWPTASLAPVQDGACLLCRSPHFEQMLALYGVKMSVIAIRVLQIKWS